ncbi:ribosome biogenesis GTPase Der [Buchnera aphidicola]|uniref:ribosome biogenesis GTPase Der n=1 Tax=Buchnera aphidicola TaxID=9 RepID=UPI0034644DDB
MTITVVLIGQTNVGKSTLFNQLTNKNSALVHNYSNFTVDRKYGVIKFDDFDVNIIDTSGINDLKSHKEPLEIQIFNQIMYSIEESNIVFFVLNIQDMVSNSQKDLINYLKKKSKKIFLVINKIDTIKNYESFFYDYYCLNVKDVFFISSLKNIGISDLKEKLRLWLIFKYKNLYNYSLNYLNKNSFIYKYKSIKYDSVIAIVGKPNVGKSTLLNTLLNKNRVVTSDTSGTTRDSISETLMMKKKRFIIIDTAGIKNKNKNLTQSLPILQTLQSISYAQIVVVMVDVKQGLTKQDLWIFNTVLSSGKRLLVLMNKSENLTLKQKIHIKNFLLSKYTIFQFIDIHFISALYKKNIKKIFFFLYKLCKCFNKPIKTSQLIKIMNHAVCQNSPQFFQGKEIKLKYAHFGGYYPPTIVIHGKRVLNLSNSYRKYLMSFFQKNLYIKGIKINIIFKNISNDKIKK